MQPCLVGWGCAWVSLMFCLEPDWAWPDCTALKQLEGYFAVWEPSQGAGGAPVIHGRMDSEGRREKPRFSLEREQHGRHKKDKCSGTHAPPNPPACYTQCTHTSPFCVCLDYLLRRYTFIKTKTHTPKYKATEKYCILLLTVWYSQFWHETHRRIRGSNAS